MFTPDTEVRLLSNVPLSNKYDHQMDFSDKVAQTTYFLSKVSHTFTKTTYQREGMAVKLPIGYDSVYDCNYIMYKNSNYTDKWFYAFITKKEYVNPNTTRIYFDMDVWQTWQFDITFKDSFVEREHCDRWNADGSPVINTVDEGLNYGTDYNVVSVDKYIPYTDVFFLVMVAKSPMHLSGTPVASSALIGAPQPLSYYVHPFRMDLTIPFVNVDGAAVSIDGILSVLDSLYATDNAVNNIVSLYVTNYFGLPCTDANGNLSFQSQNVKNVTITDANNITINTLHVEEIVVYQTLSKDFGDKYANFTAETESKLMMHPYKVISLTDFRGNHVDLKPQYINLTNLMLTVRAALGTENKVAYTVDAYNTNGLTESDAQTVTLETGLIDNNANDIPILSDYLAAYLQGNRNTVNNQKDAIVFNGVMSTIGSVMGGIGAGMSGNPVGLVDAGTNVAEGMGRTLFEIKGLNAKLSDINNIPPQLVKMGNNTAFDYGNGYTGVFVIKKEIKSEYRKKLTDFFKMFGYKLNEVKTPDLKSRANFNFIKTIGANLVGNVPHEELAQIKAMFDNGVTIWHGDYVGDYSQVNNEV